MLSFFPRDVLDEILNFIESVSEGFPSYSCSKFSFLDRDVPRFTSYGVYICQLIRFARVSSHVTNFNARNEILTGKLLHQGYRYHKF